ncbi:hypothetical protein SCALM49S_04281 [Streptomyces californicus]
MWHAGPVRSVVAGAGRTTGAATFVSRTAHAFSSGWKEIGSTASLVTAFTARYSPNRSFQWNGAKHSPARTRSVIRAGSTARPRREAASTPSPSVRPSAAASSGWTSMNGPGSSRFSLPIFAVLVSVCHWCWSRPVLRRYGKSSSGISAGGSCGRAWKTARPPGSGKASLGTLPSGRTVSSWLTPSLR